MFRCKSCVYIYIYYYLYKLYVYCFGACDLLMHSLLIVLSLTDSALHLTVAEIGCVQVPVIYI